MSQKLCDDELQEMLKYIEEIVLSAGKLVKDAFLQRDKVVDYKLSSSDLVTETDVRVEKYLIGRIKEKWPEHSFLCEETSKKTDELTNSPTWMVDPIDGTMNFVHNLPFVAISIGFAINKEVLLGVVYAPMLDELYTAVKGKGAYIRAPGSETCERLRVAQKRPLKEAVVATGFGVAVIRKLHDPDLRKTLSSEEIRLCEEFEDAVTKNTLQLIRESRDLRRLGSCAIDMAWTAAGRLDAMTELGPKEWDCSAGYLLVTEAGGFCANIDGVTPLNISSRQILAASSTDLAAEMGRKLRAPKFSLKLLEH